MKYEYLVLFVADDGRKIRVSTISSTKEINDTNIVKEIIDKKYPEFTRTFILDYRLLRKVKGEK